MADSALFIGGPLSGRTLSFSRQPLYLRVVHTPGTGKVDALDQLEDFPREGEEVSVYFREPGHVHVCGENRVRDSGWVATYAHLAHVDGEQLRDTETWRAWAERQPADRRPTAA